MIRLQSKYYRGDALVVPVAGNLIGVVLWGQSNAVGTNSDTGSIPGYLSSFITNAYISPVYYSTVFNTLEYDVNNQGSVMGPEMSMAYEYVLAKDKKFHMVKVAAGGIGISNTTGFFHPNAPSSKYPQLQEAATHLKDKIISLGQTPILVYVYIGGEAAAANSTVANSWKTDFEAIMTELAADGVAPDYNIISILSSTQSLNATNKAIVIGKMNDYIGENANSFALDMESLAFGADDLHYTCASQVTIGERIFDLINPLPI